MIILLRKKLPILRGEAERILTEVLDSEAHRCEKKAEAY